MDFFKRIPSAFIYPFKGQGWIMFIIAAILMLMLWFASMAPAIGGIAALFIVIYLLAYYLKIIRSTSEGEEELPDWPQLADISREVTAPVGHFFITLLICFLGPEIIWGMKLEGNYWHAIAWVWLCLGCIIFPMAVLRVTLMESMRGINPLGIIKTIVRIPVAYFFTVILYLILTSLGAFTFFSGIGYFLPVCISIVIMLYSSLVLSRIMGLLYLHREAAFGWDE